MSNTTRSFKADTWQSAILSLLSTYRVMHSYFTNSNALNEFLQSHDEIMATAVASELETAKEVYSQQMVVTANSYIELILKDFLVALFRKFPERMHDFLFASGQGLKGFVSLTEIVESGSLDILLDNLSERAASNVMVGKFKTCLINLDKLAKETIPQELKDKLVPIVEQRNRIVHEASKEKALDAELVLESCWSLVTYLDAVASKQGIPSDNIFLMSISPTL